jgi:hypothetical protein
LEDKRCAIVRRERGAEPLFAEPDAVTRCRIEKIDSGRHAGDDKLGGSAVLHGFVQVAEACSTETQAADRDVCIADPFSFKRHVTSSPGWHFLQQAEFGSRQLQP